MDFNFEELKIILKWFDVYLKEHGTNGDDEGVELKLREKLNEIEHPYPEKANASSDNISSGQEGENGENEAHPGQPERVLESYQRAYLQSSTQAKIPIQTQEAER